MAVSDEQVLGWLQNHPGATDREIYEAMKINDVTPEQLSRVTGKSVDEIGTRITQVEQQFPNVVANANNTVADWQIRKWLQQNQGATDEQIYSAMRQYNVSPEQLSRVSGTPISEIEQRMVPFMPTGQVGFETATQAGVQQATQSLNQAQKEVARLYGLNVQDVQAAQTQARADLEAAQKQMAEQYGLNIEDIQAAQQQAMQDVRSTFGQAAGAYQPYQTAGETALQRQMALSGAMGPEAFQQAYVEDPYIAFLREQGMRTNLAGAAATGGLGGGNVQKELQRFGQGLAAQGVQQQIQNLGALSGMGLNAAGGAAGVQQALGTNLANLGMSGAEMTAAQRAALAGQYGQTGANLANLGMTGAEMLTGQRGALAGYQSQTGVNLANLQAQAAANIANQRAATAQLLAGQIGAGATGLGNLAVSQGQDIAGGITNWTNAIQAAQQTAAQNAAAAAQQYGTAQSALATGQPFQQAPVLDYGQTVTGALSAAGTGYNLGEMYANRAGTTSAPVGYVGPMSRDWPTWGGSYQGGWQPPAATPNIMDLIMRGVPGYQPTAGYPTNVGQGTGLYYNGLKNL